MYGKNIVSSILGKKNKLKGRLVKDKISLNREEYEQHPDNPELFWSKKSRRYVRFFRSRYSKND
jgi:hypothetical protein